MPLSRYVFGATCSGQMDTSGAKSHNIGYGMGRIEAYWHPHSVHVQISPFDLPLFVTRLGEDQQRPAFARHDKCELWVVNEVSV
jgi:hypothetical protein